MGAPPTSDPSGPAMRHLLLPLLVALAGPAGAAERYVGVFAGSEHIGSDAFNDFNPGLTLGWRRPVGQGRFQHFVEGGVIYNSYDEVSPLLFTGLSAPVATLGGGELHLGVAAGLAYYRELSDQFDEDGIPTLGPFIPLVTANAAWRFERVEYRLTALPPGGDVDGVLTFSVAFPF